MSPAYQIAIYHSGKFNKFILYAAAGRKFHPSRIRDSIGIELKVGRGCNLKLVTVEGWLAALGPKWGRYV